MVYIQVVFIKLGEIDTVKETFSADVFVQARWREPTLDGNYKARTTVFDAQFSGLLLDVEINVIGRIFESKLSLKNMPIIKLRTNVAFLNSFLFTIRSGVLYIFASLCLFICCTIPL